MNALPFVALLLLFHAVVSWAIRQLPGRKEI